MCTLSLAGAPQPDRYYVVLAITDPEKRLSEWDAFAKRLPESEISFWLRRAEALPEWRDRAVLQLALLQQWSTYRPQASADFAEKLPLGRFQAECLSLILRQWVKQDPQSAASYVKGIPSDKIYRKIAINCVIEEWGKSSPEAVLRWIEQQGNHICDDALHTLLFIWVHEDPVCAWEKIKTLPTGSTRQMLITNTAVAWAKKDPSAALAWAQTLPAENEKSLAQSAIAESWSCREPLAAAQFSLTLPRNNMRAGVVPAVIANWTLQNPHAAGDWLAAQTTTTSVEQTTSLRNLMNIWADRDPQAAARWVGTLPFGHFRDEAIQHFVAPATRWVPELAADLTQTISSAPLKQATLNACLQQWQNLDAAAMHAWLAKSPPAPPVHSD